MLINQYTTKNYLLLSMDPDDSAAIGSYLEPVELPRLTMMTTTGERSLYAYFIEAGLGSVVVGTRNGLRCEVGVIGRDGMVDASLLLGAEVSPFDTFMQIGGYGWRMPASALIELVDGSLTLRRQLLRYVQNMAVQTAHTALANATYSVEERLARWLLLALDRSDDNRVALTHEFLSLMLAVRRPSVTVALHVLEGERWIKATRGLITVIDRAGLEQFAGNAYARSRDGRELCRALPVEIRTGPPPTVSTFSAITQIAA